MFTNFFWEKKIKNVNSAIFWARDLQFSPKKTPKKLFFNFLEKNVKISMWEWIGSIGDLNWVEIFTSRKLLMVLLYIE